MTDLEVIRYTCIIINRHLAEDPTARIEALRAIEMPASCSCVLFRCSVTDDVIGCIKSEPHTSKIAASQIATILAFGNVFAVSFAEDCIDDGGVITLIASRSR